MRLQAFEISGDFRFRRSESARRSRVDAFLRELLLGREPIVDVVPVCRAASQVKLIGTAGNFFVLKCRISGRTFQRAATFPFRTHGTLSKEQTMYQGETR